MSQPTYPTSVEFQAVSYCGAYQGLRVVLGTLQGEGNATQVVRRTFPSADEVYCSPLTKAGKTRALRAAWKAATGQALPRTITVPA